MASGWNGSDRRGNSTPVQPKVTAKKPSPIRGLIAGGLVCVLAVGVYIAFFAGSENSKTELADKDRGRIKVVTPAEVKKCVPDVDKAVVDKEREIAREMDEKIKPFITKRMTNAVEILGYKPLDPGDPDNAMRTKVAKDIGTLLSFPPGEPIPEIIPMFCILGGEGEDGGNKDFLDSLKKWQITIKEGDSEATAESKKNIFDAQLELIDDVEKGLTVNDSLRAAYEYRVKAAEYRTSLVDMIRELHKDEVDANAAVEMVKKANAMLDEKGFIRIQMEDVFSNEELESPVFDAYFAEREAAEKKVAEEQSAEGNEEK